VCQSGERLDASQGSAAYDNELGGRMWVGAVDRRLFDLSIEGSTALFLGEFARSFIWASRGTIKLGRQLMTPALTGPVARNQSGDSDADCNELDAKRTREALGSPGVERTFDPGGKVALGASGPTGTSPDETSPRWVPPRRS